MVYSANTKQSILHYVKANVKPPSIKKLLEEEDIRTTRQGIRQFFKKYRARGVLDRNPDSGRCP